jgi:acyl-CoA reductase-like NAD-dependent aldehyde dehydrogenase
MTTITAELLDLGGKPRDYSLLIDGKLIGVDQRERIERASPATGKPVSTYPAATDQDVQEAIRTARRAADLRKWASVSGAERSRLILRVAGLIDKHRKELGMIECLEGGKPISAVDGEIQASIDLWEFAATLARHMYGDTHDQLGDETMGLVFREPIGVVGMITPWNFPLLIVGQKLPFALAAGCCAVVKPSEFTSGTTLRLGELLLEAGLPDGVVNIIAGDGPTVGQRICESAAVDMVSFTGSTRVGKEIRRFGDGLKKISLELGGKSAHIVCGDADLDAAAAAVVHGATVNAGQCCVSGSRLLVEHSVADAFCQSVVERMRALRVGDPLDATTQVGPLINGAQFKRVTTYVDKGVKEGATLLLGGNDPANAGYFVSPVVFDNVNQGMRIAQEEIFGPVLSVMRFETVDQAIEIANGTPYGLAAGLWTKNVDKAFYFVRRLNAGTIEINTYIAGVPELPLSGYGDSGLGHEKSRFAIDEFTRLKTVQFKFGNI